MRAVPLRVVALVLAIGGTAAAATVGQDFFRRRAQQPEVEANAPSDGRVVFVRLRYANTPEAMFRRGSNGELPWAHDYPTADVHMMKIINELTLLRPRVEGSNVFTLADPELHQFPLAYMSEPGFWVLDDEEAAGLRAYLLKGGFIIFDDFREIDWYNLEFQMKKVLPEAIWMQLDSSHPIFHSFFEINDLEFVTGYSDRPTYWGIFEDNDPRKRLMAIANRDNDLGEYWEFSDTGYMPVDLSNEAYKFGVNYFMYALTH